jgi:hypothetical protein
MFKLKENMKKKKSAKDMNKQERLDATANSIRDALDPFGTEDGRANPSYPDSLFNMNIGPIKPDPERNANQSIDRAVNGGRSAEMLKMIEARKNNPINPETGMPYYSDDDSAVRESELMAPRQQMTAEDEERRAIRMQLLREAAKTGKMPEYLKKY